MAGSKPSPGASAGQRAPPPIGRGEPGVATDEEPIAPATVADVDLASSVSHGGLSREEMLPFIPPGAKTILDVGCSRGRFGALLRQEDAARKLVGIEPEMAAAEEAAAHYDEVICGLFPDDLPTGRLFDCIVCNDVIEHTADPWRILRATEQFLAPGGCVVASIPNVRYYIVVRDLLLRGRFDYADWGVLDRTHLRFFTRSSIEQLFPACGYTIESLTPINPIKLRRAALLDLVGWRDMRYPQFAVVARRATEASNGG